jgi:diguanylate cyclase (GGDEF)-like protein
VKILVADDSVTFLTLITDSLKRLGHEVVQAKSGAEALMLYQQSLPDLIILDVTMPVMSGFECAKKIREMNSEDWIPIIFMSASVDDESIAKGIEAGGDDYLTKPYSDITLEAKIHAMQRIALMRQQLLQKTDELNRASVTDMLTGLYNRYYFERVIKKKMSSALRHQRNMAVLFVDLDHFKSINDTFGHGAGDILLKEVSSRLQKCIRIEDTICRIGGDEFIIILENVENLHEAGEVARKIVNELNKDYKINDIDVKISASIGVTCYPEQPGDTATILQNADIAMYAAKQLGRNNFQCYSKSLNERYRHQLGLEHELKFAIERKQMRIYYQPIYDLLTHQIVEAEALLRWEHPLYGNISPDIFIPIAEETGLIMEIGMWVLENVCIQGVKWLDLVNKDFVLSVNVSSQQLKNDYFMNLLIEILNKTQMRPHNLGLELTENTVITYTTNLRETMRSLHEMGVRVAIDDFGTRYSSLTSLHQLPISTLKIDREFVRDASKDKKNTIIVKSLIALGENLNLNVVAEGIQTKEELQFMLVHGCRFGQGELLMKPLPADQMEKLLSQNTLVKGEK